MKTRIFKRFLLALSLGMVPLSFAQGVVSSMINYTIIHSAVQTEGYCETTMPMNAEFGIPLDPYIQGMLAPARIAHHVIGRPLQFQNINVLANQGIRYELVEDRYDESTGVYDYWVEFDFSSLRSQASTRAQRQEAIDIVKLAVIAANSNAREAVGRYRLHLTLNNLPSQSGLSGSRVYRQTQYPFSWRSPLLEQYRSELINTQGECN